MENRIKDFIQQYKLRAFDIDGKIESVQEEIKKERTQNGRESAEYGKLLEIKIQLHDQRQICIQAAHDFESLLEMAE